MKVILLEEIPSLGPAGAVVEVARGYARNWLIPQGKALAADERNLRALAHQRRLAEARLRRLRREAADLAQRIERCCVTIARPQGEEGRIFGAVTSRDIAEALRAEGLEVDRRKILLEEPIKALGEHVVPVRVYPEVTAALRVRVVPEGAAEQVEGGGA